MLSEDDHFYGLNDTRISVEGQFKSCALHLSCAFCSIIHRADSGRRVFHLASFSPWPSDLTELSAIREDPPKDLSPYSKGRRMIGKGWYTTLGFVCAAPHPVSISKGREVEEGDNALVPPIFPISSTYSTTVYNGEHARCSSTLNVILSAGPAVYKCITWEWRDTHYDYMTFEENKLWP